MFSREIEKLEVVKKDRGVKGTEREYPGVEQRFDETVGKGESVHNKASAEVAARVGPSSKRVDGN